MWDYNTTRIMHCIVCGKGFRDDCGDVFCSSGCSQQYEDEHAECESCGEEVGIENLIDDKCTACREEEENEK